MRRLILRSFQSPGDIVMLTAAVRDLHRAHPGQFQTDVRTSADALWENNPYLTPLRETDPDVRSLDMHYPLIHQSNQRPYHFLHGYVQFLEHQLDVRIPVTEFRGDVHLSDVEKQAPLNFGNTQLPERYWIIVAGGKYDFTAKWWNPASYQQVVDRLRDRVTFVQCGQAEHWHPPLDGVIDLVGQTGPSRDSLGAHAPTSDSHWSDSSEPTARGGLRDFVRLMYRADGVVCPVTLAMHLAAAVETPPNVKRQRPCVVVAGGREPTHWEAYPHHQYLSTVGMLSCCANGGCWKSRCQLVGDGDPKDRRDRCEQPVQIHPDLAIPRCMEMITADDVIRRIELYLDGDAAQTETPPPTRAKRTALDTPELRSASPPTIVVQCDGRSDELVPMGIIRNHLLHYHPAWQVEFASAQRNEEFRQLLGLNGTVADKSSHSRRVYLNGRAGSPRAFPNWPSTPAAAWLLDELRLTPIEDLFRYRLSVPARAQDQIQASFRDIFGDIDETDRWPLVVVDVGQQGAEPQHWHSAAFAAVREAGYVLGVMSWSQSGEAAVLEIVHDSGRRQTIELQSIGEVLAVIARSRLSVGNETGCVSLVNGLNTPAVTIWESTHPIHVIEPSPHVLHLVPANHASLSAGPAATAYFERTYRFHLAEQLETTVPETIREALRTSAVAPQTARTSPAEVDSPKTVSTVPSPDPDGPMTQARAVTAPVAETAIPFAESPPPPSPQLEDRPLHSVRFYHGLGDAANFARLIPLYTRRGHRFGVECTPDKEVLFKAAGAEIVSQAESTHDWGYPPQDVHSGHGGDHLGSKAGWNISQTPLPNIGDKADLWPEYCQTRVRVIPFIPPHARDFIANWLSDLPRPIVLLHTKGNTNQSVKSLPDQVALAFYKELLDRFDGTIVLLDWDNRVPRLATYRVRHLSEMSGGCSSERLFALMDQADLVIGVDSGPLHAAGLTDTPRVGIWMPGHYPARYSLPDPLQLNLVLAAHTYPWNRYRRVPWNINEQPGSTWDAAWLAKQCSRMLRPPRYLAESSKGADVQLQHWVSDLCRGDRSNWGAPYTDRNRSFDLLLRTATERFHEPTFVETGTIRAEEDWPGAGYSTYLFSSYLRHRGGRLHSVDLSLQHCQFARTWCQVFGPTVQIHQQDSLEFLKQFPGTIDVLYLDSLDTTEPGHAEHALREAQTAIHALHERSLILFDDTPWRDGAFSGKGAQAVPWLLKNGWEILYAGYQVLLERRTS